jgi:diacylglycerol O-acyltransferase / wax synthase
VGYATIGIPLDDIRAIRAAGGGTINDVLVTVVAGALERYGKKHNIRIDKRHALIAFTANLRQDKNSGRLNNRSAASMLAVPFNLSDPRERLRWVTEHTRIAKETGMAQGVWNFIAAWRAVLTPPGLALLYSTLSIPWIQRAAHRFLLRPPGHLYFSNIRAPEFPLYLLGAKLISRNPVPPLIPMLSLASAAVTMHKFMRLSFSGDANLVPDVSDLANFAADAFQELRDAFPEAEYPAERPSIARAGREPADV